MGQATAQIRTLSHTSVAIGAAGARTVPFDRSKKAGGEGLGFNGAELHLLVRVPDDWGGEPACAQNVSFSVKVDADASEADIPALIRYRDRVAEVPNSQRLGTEVKLTNADAVSRA